MKLTSSWSTNYMLHTVPVLDVPKYFYCIRDIIVEVTGVNFISCCQYKYFKFISSLTWLSLSWEDVKD